ncbi:unnamed protein product [Amoebophrya sp. A25]|nr:unnamed protein product [Amoebophrya sp. A25]|eukprot:GSA25T00002244001.1
MTAIDVHPVCLDKKTRTSKSAASKMNVPTGGDVPAVNRTSLATASISGKDGNNYRHEYSHSVGANGVTYSYPGAHVSCPSSPSICTGTSHYGDKHLKQNKKAKTKKTKRVPREEGVENTTSLVRRPPEDTPRLRLVHRSVPST